MTTPMKATHNLVNLKGESYDVYLDKSGDWWIALDHSIYFTPKYIQSVNPLPAPTEPETFDWKEAVKFITNEINIQGKANNGDWVDWNGDDFSICLDKKREYRRKPSPPPEPKVTVSYRNYCPDGICREWNTLLEAESHDLNATARLKITITEGVKLPKVEVIEID